MVYEIKLQFEGNLTKRFYVFNGLLGLNLSKLFVWSRIPTARDGFSALIKTFSSCIALATGLKKDKIREQIVKFLGKRIN